MVSNNIACSCPVSDYRCIKINFHDPNKTLHKVDKMMNPFAFGYPSTDMGFVYVEAECNYNLWQKSSVYTKDMQSSFSYY